MEKKERYRWNGSDRERRKEERGEETVIKIEEKMWFRLCKEALCFSDYIQSL
jgi:hypothetical protein